MQQSLTRVLQLKEGVMVLNRADCTNSTTITDNVSFAGVKKFINDNDDDLCNRIKPCLSKLLNMLVLPSFSATSSLIMNSIDTTPINVFATPLIGGPASDYSAIYTGLMRAHGIAVWSCGASVKAIISLDLDLYEKIYLLVNSNSEIRDKYILCLGELHAVFIHIRAIGNLITSSGIEEAWKGAGWFDGLPVIRQILECKHMRQALEGHEATLVTFSCIMLKTIVKENPSLSLDIEQLQELLNKAQGSIHKKDQISLREMEMEDIELESKLRVFS